MRTLAIFSTLSAGITYRLEGRGVRQISCTNALISSPQIIFVIMFTPRTLSFDLRDLSQKLYWLAETEKLLFGTIFLRTFALQTLHATWRDWELINGGCLYRTPTRQMCKPVNRKFDARWISSVFYCYTDIFTVFWMTTFTHSFIHSL